MFTQQELNNIKFFLLNGKFNVSAQDMVEWTKLVNKLALLTAPAEPKAKAPAKLAPKAPATK